jgi:polysaccharide export outer membrane protein
MKLSLLVLLGCLALGSAVSYRLRADEPGPRSQNSSKLQDSPQHVRPSIKAESGEDTDRKIVPSDIIVVDVFGEKDLSGEHRVQKTGIIKFPLLGTVEVAGKTPSQVADLLQEKLEADYLVDPQVNVMVKEYSARTVSVLGFVGKEGAVDLPAEQRIDIIEAIGRANGLLPTANKKRIRLSRAGKTSTYNFEDLIKKRVWVEPGDVIYVPETFF